MCVCPVQHNPWANVIKEFELHGIFACAEEAAFDREFTLVQRCLCSQGRGEAEHVHSGLVESAPCGTPPSSLSARSTRGGGIALGGNGRDDSDGVNEHNGGIPRDGPT